MISEMTDRVIMEQRSTPTIKLYGERNTGTNYLERLIRTNLEVNLLPGGVPFWIQWVSPWLEFPRDFYFALTMHRNLGWKHAMAVRKEQLERWGMPQNLYFVTITKNPYSWLLSIYRRPYHLRRPKGTFEQFLQTPWRAVGRENSPPLFESPVALWNCKNRSYLDLRGYASAINLRYEDLLADPEAVLRRIAGWLGVTLRGGQFVNIAESTKGDQVDFDYYRDYYLNERWRSRLSKEAIALINERLDARVMDAFGYSYL